MLDADTRDYLQLLVGGAGRGLKGRGTDLREVFRLFEPTHRDIARVNSAVATPPREPAPARHTRSSELSGELAGTRGRAGAAGATRRVARVPRLRERGPQHQPRPCASCRRRCARRPTRSARCERLAEVLGPGVRAPAPGRARARPQPGRAAAARARGDAAARETDPAVRARRAPAGARAAPRRRATWPTSTPDLTRVVQGAERRSSTWPPTTRAAARAPDGGRARGGLPVLARLGARTSRPTVFSTADAHGPFRPSLVAGSCQTLRADRGTTSPEAEFLLNLTPILTNPALCGE